jgi:hypothetical protein
MASIDSILICDDIRKEVSGKDILVGVYSGDIIVHSVPFTLVLAVWFEYIPGSNVKHTLDIVASYAGKQIARQKGEIHPEDSPFGIAMPGLTVSGDAEGELLIEITLGDSGQVFKKSKRIRVAADAFKASA